MLGPPCAGPMRWPRRVGIASDDGHNLDMAISLRWLGLVVALVMAAGVSGVTAATPVRAQTVCTADVRTVMIPQSGPPGTRVQLSWNSGDPGPLVVVSWDNLPLLNGVAQPQIDDCFRGVEGVVPADAKPGAHTVSADCAYCLVAFNYGTWTFTVTGPAATPTPGGATPTATVPRPVTPTSTPTAARPPDVPPLTTTPVIAPGPPRTGTGWAAGSGSPFAWSLALVCLAAGAAAVAAWRRR